MRLAPSLAISMAIRRPTPRQPPVIRHHFPFTSIILDPFAPCAEINVVSSRKYSLISRKQLRITPFLYTIVKTSLSKDIKVLRHFANYRMHHFFQIFHKIWRDVLRDTPTPRSHKATPDYIQTIATPYTAVAIYGIRDFQAIHFADGMWETRPVYRYSFTTFDSAQNKHQHPHGRTGPNLPTSRKATTPKTILKSLISIANCCRKHRSKFRVHTQGQRNTHTLALNKKLKIFYLYNRWNGRAI